VISADPTLTAYQVADATTSGVVFGDICTGRREGPCISTTLAKQSYLYNRCVLSGQGLQTLATFPRWQGVTCFSPRSEA
jgi:hypothetical protein